MNIKAIRLKLGMTPEELANELCTLVEVVDRWESGEAEPCFLYRQVIIEVAKSKGIDVEQETNSMELHPSIENWPRNDGDK